LFITSATFAISSIAQVQFRQHLFGTSVLFHVLISNGVIVVVFLLFHGNSIAPIAIAEKQIHMEKFKININ